MAANFALSPAHANANQVINFTTAGGAKFYKQAIRGLYDSGDLYDLEADGLKTFLDTLQDRIVEQNWTSIFAIPEAIAAPAANLRLLTSEYGRVSLQQVRAYVEHFNGANRQTQNAYMAYTCIMASLTDDAKAQVNIRREDFTIDGRGSGPLLLKVLISLAHVDTEATVMVLRQRLADLHIYIMDVNADIAKFNFYVDETLRALNARGEQTLDLLPNLFKAYETVNDDNFLEFIRRKKNAYEEGDNPGLTPRQLMSVARTKYQTLVEQKKWQALSARDQKLIALEASVNKLKEQKRKTNPSDQKKQTSKGKTDKATDNDKAWLTVGPKSGQSEMKEVNGKMWYWCKWHGKWSTNKNHTSATCNGRGLTGDKKRAYDAAHENSDDTTSENTGTNPGLRLASALAGATHDEDDDSDNSTDE